MAATDDRLLTAAEEIQLAKRIERGDLVAKREMIERNLRLVFAIAHLSVVALRFREPDAKRAYRVPLSVKVRGMPWMNSLKRGLGRGSTLGLSVPPPA